MQYKLRRYGGLDIVLIKKRELTELSQTIRKIIDGQEIDLRANDEGPWNILKNDIHILAQLKNEQVAVLQHDRDALKDTMADISHQLKTPLTSMMIMVDLLEHAPPEKRAEFIQTIKMGLVRTDWLVSTLLKMAKLEAGAVSFAHEPVHSADLVDLALEPLYIQLEIKNQRITLTGEAEFHCDKRWTAEALKNVLKNASEYAPADTEIRIDVGQNPICTWIAVTDGGTGLSAAQMAKLFRRFEGSQSTTGYGIGLPLARAIMRGQDGDIEVAGGGNGSGATFTLKFFK